MYEAGRECRKFSREVRMKDHPTEADYNRVIDECLEVKIKEAELEKEYYEKFRKILSPEKLYKYRDAEFKFARNYMKGGMKDKKDENIKK